MSRCLELARTLASLTFAAVTASVATPAAAIVFNSSFDPVDFFGNATFDVAPSCLGSSGFVSNNGDPCTVTWLTADVTLTNGSNSVSFSYQPEHLPDPFAVQNIFVDDGALVGVNSTIHVTGSFFPAEETYCVFGTVRQI